VSRSINHSLFLFLKKEKAGTSETDMNQFVLHSNKENRIVFKGLPFRASPGQDGKGFLKVWSPIHHGDVPHRVSVIIVSDGEALCPSVILAVLNISYQRVKNSREPKEELFF